ncbi:cell division cycle-associated protein 3 [Hoplias malabaricus]|uniref:cell division cycle-associated protein 3 n=1 Tax=Hoplias malabaricus TaxID=27720 RepID=UPI003462FDD5
MGTSESKMAVVSTPKPEPGHTIQNRRLAQLVDPRSPSCGINRTPIQVDGAAPCVREGQESAALVFDPRSPTPGIERTPMKDSMKLTVSSLARKLSTFFLNDTGIVDSSTTSLSPVTITKHPSLPSVEQQDNPSCSEPLLPSQGTQTAHKASPSSPVACSPSVRYGSFCSSPFVLVGEVEVDMATDVSLEEAEEALLLGESPLQRELSLSLLACRDGVYPPDFCKSTEERPSTPLPPAELKQNGDHSYGLQVVSSESTQLSSPTQASIISPANDAEPHEQQDVTEEAPVVSEQEPEKPKVVTPDPVDAPCLNLTGQKEVPPSGFLIPRFDTRSPSQAVFKPQWLGVGFGATGVRARGVQSRGKGTASPRKKATDENENKVVLSRQKQRGKALIAEGRSPLQILKETNSPRDRPAQMKLKVSTPEKRRFGQMDRRNLVVSLNKENQ